MNEALAVRLARSADAAEIAAMARDYIEHGLPWTWTELRVARCVADANTNVVVVGERRAIVGFGIMSYLDEDSHLLLFAVRRSHQRKGIGTAILRWLEECARSAGSTRIRVECRRDNDAARSFYNEHGYQELAIGKRMYRGIADGIMLEKWLRTT
jgi:ribosomal-protein-alanine N-acetyltransferase